MPKRASHRRVRGGSPEAKRAKKTPAASNSGPEAQKSCTLGIDIGSHRTRACLWTESGAKVIENRHSYGIGGTSFPGEFPSEIYVFDEQPSAISGPPAPLYLVDRQDTTRQSVSAKYVFYILANAGDKLLEQYPPVHHLRARKDDAQFRARLRQGLVDLLSVLREEVLARCREENVHITKIGLTLPVQWTLEFEDVYRALVSEVFTMDPAIIFFFTETEALARYMYKFHASKVDPRQEYSTIMFIDYGGHNMNGCLFGVSRDAHDPFGNGFFRIGKAFGAGGGSEQWEHHVAMWFSTQWSDQTETPVPPEYLEEFLNKFRPQKGQSTDSRKSVSMICPFTRDYMDSHSGFLLQLSVEDIQHTWRKGLERPLNVAARQMERLADMAKTDSERVPNPVVVVSGGTARNPAVKSHMMDLGERHEIPIVFTDNFVGLTYDSAKVATAAAYVVSETLTVEQFFARGAAIGIQMRQCSKQGKPKPAVRLWDHSACVLLECETGGAGGAASNNTKAYAVTLPVRNGDEFKLVCDSFFALLPENQRQVMRVKRAYDLIYLGKRKQGTWKFSMYLTDTAAAEDNNDDDHKWQLVLSQHYKRRQNLHWTPMETLRLPLYFDGNSGCVQVGARDKSIMEQQALNLPRQPEDEATSSSESDSESDGLDEDSDDDDDEYYDAEEEEEDDPVPEKRRRRMKPQYPLSKIGPFF